MARKTGQTSEALDDIQGAADKFGDWIQENLKVIGTVIGGLLVVAGGFSYVGTLEASAEGEASQSLAEVRNAYLEAMGAAPGSIEVPELANPDAARRIREEYGARFGEVADAHEGTVSGALARMEVAQLAADAGDHGEALALYEQALDEGAGGDRFRGLLLQRVGQALEEAERWEDAAARHEEAADLSGYPLRHWALADAARCRAEAGEPDAARALYERLEEEAPELRLPDYQRAQMRELTVAGEL